MHNELEEQIRAKARQVQNYQIERAWSDARLLKEIPQLGSTKTFKRLLNTKDKLEQVNLANQLRSLDSALATIESRRKSDQRAEPDYDDFNNIIDTLSAVAEALHEEQSIARFVAIQGENGTGKTTTARALAREYPNGLIAVEALDGWRDSRGAPFTALLQAFNSARKAQVKIPVYPIDRFGALVDAINDQRLVILIDEAHYLSPRTLNDLKSLINKCPRIALVCLFIPSLLRRLRTNAYEEAAQLFGNRMSRTVHLQNPQANEVLDLLQRRGVTFVNDEEATAAVANLVQDAPELGNWRYISQFAREAYAENKDKPLNKAAFEEARDKTKARRLTAQGRAA